MSDRQLQRALLRMVRIGHAQQHRMYDGDKGNVRIIRQFDAQRCGLVSRQVLDERRRMGNHRNGGLGFARIDGS